MLHHYASELQRQRKSVSANKKNRLPLTGCVVSPIVSSSPGRCDMCLSVISTYVTGIDFNPVDVSA